jgi:DNA helicase-2/ATP-dependent DNA helicase PcrA
MVKGITGAQGAAMSAAAALMTGIREMEEAGATVDRLMERAIDGSGLRDAFRAEGTMEAQGRLENLDELVSVAQEYSARADEPSLAGFLQEIALFADADSLVTEGGRVTLMTIHNAKGLEFEVVVIAGLEEGIFPHQRSFDAPEALEEERRLCYVGLTRARRRLVLTHAQSRLMHGGRDFRLPSRFLNEIPADAIAQAGAPMRQGRPEPALRGLELATGDEVVHATFGEGTIVAVEQGGELVRVRFSSDGAERRLMAGYAPMRKVAS